MSEISVYDIVPTPKLADKLIGTSVGGVIPDVTYNFTLEELLQLFIPNIPANNLQGVLNYGNTATQDINLTGTINTTDLNVFATASILDSILSGETHITGELYDGLDSKGTAGQVLTSTGSGVEWYTIPTVIPTLQQVLTSGNTSDVSIILTANITAVTATATNVVSNTSLAVNGVLKDGTASAGGSNQILSSTGSGVQWVDMPVYNAVSPLLYDNPTKTFSIQVANSTQSGYLTSSDWITFDGKQDPILLTTTGTSGASTFIGNTLNIPIYTPDLSGYVPESRTLTINGITYDLSANRTWTIPAGVAEVTATSPLFSTGGAYPDISIQIANTSQDGYLSATDWNTFNSKLSSVGLSMPSAFSVANSPLTSNGTIAVTGAGVASQYVRGDGTLANFPSSGGGGSSVSYYLNGGVSQGTIDGNPYEQMSKVPVIGTNADFNINTDGYIANFVTDAGDPSLLNIPAGNWNFEMYFSSSSAGGTPSFYVELYKYDGTTLTPIANSSATPEAITGGTTIDLYTTAVAVPSTTLTITDRLAVRIYVLNSGRTITLHTQDSHLCEIITTFSTGITALNGLTQQVQYFAVGTAGTDFNISSVTDIHTFNLPTASAVNRGALSSADWIAFNSKVDGSGTTNYIPKFTAASVLGNSNIQDSGSLITLGSDSYVNGSLGIGTSDLTAYNLRINKNITGATTSYSILTEGTIQSDVTNARMFNSKPATVDSTFTITNLSHYLAQQGTFGASSTVTSQYGFFVDTSLTGAANNYAFYSSLAAGTNRWNLYMNGTANNYLAGALGIGSTSLTGYGLRLALPITGSISSVGFFNSGIIQSDVTSSTYYNRTSSATAAASFTLTNIYHYGATQGTFGAGSTVTNQYGFLVASSLTGATNNYAFAGQLASANNVWNLYMSGTANNYLAGSLGIGTTSLTQYNLRVSKNITGATTAYGIYLDSTIQSDVTNIGYMFMSAPSIASSFAANSVHHFRANPVTLNSGSSISTQVGYMVSSAFTNAAANFAFRSDMPATSGSFNLYMNGTADNYLAGALGIGTTSLTGYNLRVAKNLTGSTSVYNIASFGTIQSDATSSASYFETSAATQATAFTIGSLRHFYANQSTIGAGSVVTSQYGFLVGATLVGATNNYAFFGDIPSGTNRWNLYMSGTANNYLAGSLGIGQTSLANYNLRLTKNITGATTSYAIRQDGVVQSDSTTAAYGMRNDMNTAAASFTVGSYSHYYATEGTIGAGSAVTNQYGFTATSSMTSATNNYGFFGAIAAGTNRWNIYMGGTAQNYLAGALSIGVTTANASALLQVDSTTKGFLPPRMTATQRAAISSPAEGLIVFQTDGTVGLYLYASAAWHALTML